MIGIVRKVAVQIGEFETGSFRCQNETDNQEEQANEFHSNMLSNRGALLTG